MPVLIIVNHKKVAMILFIITNNLFISMVEVPLVFSIRRLIRPEKLLRIAIYDFKCIISGFDFPVQE